MNAHWHLLTKNTIKVCETVNVKIATFERDKPNHTLARCGNFFQHCFTKTSLKIYLSVTKTYTLQNSIGKKKTYSGKQKHIPVPEKMKEHFFHLLRLELILFWYLNLRSHFVVRNLALMFYNSCQEIDGFFGEQFFKNNLSKCVTLTQIKKKE
jgi:hypothetical protein